MFAKGRNMMQAHIDETAIVLERLLFEVPQQIEVAFQSLEQKISNEAMAVAEDDSAVRRQFPRHQPLSEGSRLCADHRRLRRSFAGAALHARACRHRS